MTSVLGSAEETRLEAVIECLEVGVILLDLDGVVEQVNELAMIILGIEREDALRLVFDQLETRSPHYLKIRSAIGRMSNYPAAERREEVSLHVRGRDHIYVLKAVPVQSDSHRSLGTIVTLQDISHLRDKDRARSNLVATLSHEIKSPLTSISLAVDLLERDFTPLDQRQQELVSAVVEDVARISELSDSLLNLAKGETTSIAVRNVTLDIAKLVASVKDKFIVQAKQKKVSLECRIEPQLTSQGDPVKLSWVISSLVANAIRSTPAGGRIDVSVKVAGGRIRVSVSDDGPGIVTEICDRIFERFTQPISDGLDLDHTELGLAVAKEIVEAHGGRIFVERSSVGSTFSVELPAVRGI
jgi:NtrC-family two-component system sensor histidine kinase KinB